MAGSISSTGFVLPTMEDIEAELQAALLSNISPTLDLSAESPLGQIVSIFARQIVRAWEALATAYGSVDPQKAEGVLLDNICALIGVVRLAATKSTVTCDLSLNAGVTVPAGSRVGVNGATSTQFSLVSAVTSTTAGTYQGVFQALSTGPTVANASTLQQIITPVSGWTAVNNQKDATLGRNVETDTELRVRRQSELALPGAGGADAIRAGVLAVPGVLQCRVFENCLGSADAAGVPGHAFDTVVWDGIVPGAQNADIVAAIYNNKDAGIQAYGSTYSTNYTDASGNTIPIAFTRATQKNIYQSITVKVDPVIFDMVNGATTIANLLANKGNALQLGEDVVSLVYQSLPLSLPGVIDVTFYQHGFVALSLTSANLTIAPREIPLFDTGRITVVLAT